MMSSYIEIGIEFHSLIAVINKKSDYIRRYAICIDRMKLPDDLRLQY